MLDFYQHLPELINPVVFSIGHFSVRWYSVMYLVALGVVYGLLVLRIKKDGLSLRTIGQEGKIANLSNENKLKDVALDLLYYCFLGLLIGARLGHVFFYNFDYFWQNPLAVISPYDPETGTFTGIYGMSYFGGALGICIAGFLFSCKRKINFFELADFVVPAIPAGYFFGRIGNFLNGELYGRVTQGAWGMYFPGDQFSLRHPTQLYEAMLEGIVLFLLVWSLRKKRTLKGKLLWLYLTSYGIVRFGIEFLREQNPGESVFFGIINMSHVLALSIIVISAIFIARGEFVGKKDQAC